MKSETAVRSAQPAWTPQHTMKVNAKWLRQFRGCRTIPAPLGFTTATTCLGHRHCPLGFSPVSLDYFDNMPFQVQRNIRAGARGVRYNREKPVGYCFPKWMISYHVFGVLWKIALNICLGPHLAPLRVLVGRQTLPLRYAPQNGPTDG